MKKLYAVADEVPEDVDYLTAGKEYEIISEANRRAHRCRAFEFLDDTGARLVAMELDCPHLNGGNWRIIEREDEEPTPSLTEINDQCAAALAQQVGASIKAHKILDAAAGHLEDRAATYDKPEGERSMGAAVAAFSAISGVTMTEEQGWLFMALLKAVRTQQGNYRADNYEDGAAYFALAGESAAKGRA